MKERERAKEGRGASNRGYDRGNLLLLTFSILSLRALEICMEQGMPDLMLLDIMMPGMSGYEVCRKLREMEGANCVPILMVSAKVKRHS